MYAFPSHEHRGAKQSMHSDNQQYEIVMHWEDTCLGLCIPGYCKDGVSVLQKLSWQGSEVW